MEKILDDLRDFIVTRFDIDEDDEEFTNDVDMFLYGYVDSFGATEIINFMEEKFGVSITNKDLVKYPMNSIDEIVAFITERLGE